MRARLTSLSNSKGRFEETPHGQGPRCQFQKSSAKSGWLVKLITAALSLGITLSIIAGEFCALYALTIGEGTTALAKPVCAAIAFSLLIIALEFLKPILDALNGVWKTVYFAVIVLSVFLAMMLFWNALPK